MPILVAAAKAAGNAAAKHPLAGYQSFGDEAVNCTPQDASVPVEIRIDDLLSRRPPMRR